MLNLNEISRNIVGTVFRLFIRIHRKHKFMKQNTSIYTVITFFFVVSIIFTACKSSISTDREEQEVKAIDVIIDKWHKAATEADFATYFDLMDAEAYFIGTDASEKWNIDEFKSFCEPIFAKGSAWEFIKMKREIFIDKGGEIAWFDEQLDTWMGVCMSSGVVVKTLKGWKIKHYQLSIAVPNDIVNDFVQLVNKYEESKNKIEE